MKLNEQNDNSTQNINEEISEVNKKERRTSLDQYPDIMNSNDLAEYMGLSRQVTLRFFHIQGFPCLRAHNGRRFLIVKSALKEWLHKTASNS